MTGVKWRGWLSQVLRGIAGLSFPYFLSVIPLEPRTTGLVLAGAVALYIGARIGSLFEPETLRRGGGAVSYIGEALFVSLAITMALVLVGESGYVHVGVGAAIVTVIGYLIFHALVLPMVARHQIQATEDAPVRPLLRRFVYVGAFIAEEGAALMCMALAVHVNVEARQGPWGLLDVVPVFPLVLLAFFYFPVLRLQTASHPGLTSEQSKAAAFEGALLQGAAVLLAAFTGTNPWI